MKGVIYIAGPMRGVPLYNFPAFDAATKKFREAGWEVISPAEMDRDKGFTETMPEPSATFLKAAIARDLSAISICTAIALLPGWEASRGVRVELALAEFLEIPIYCADSMERMSL